MNLIKKIANTLFRSPTKFKTYKNYHHAMQEATQFGYEDHELVEVVFQKTKLYQQRLQQQEHSEIDFKTANLLVAILSIQKAQVNVFDLGGACGAHYFEVRKLLPPNIKLQWTVVETPIMARRAGELKNGELSFSDDLIKVSKQIGKIDLLHTSGTLQCVDDPIHYLKQIIATDASYLLFNRMSFTLQNAPITILHESFLWEHGIGKFSDNTAYQKILKYPYSYIPQQNFDEVMASSHYQLLLEFKDESGSSYINDAEIIGKGLLFKQKGSI